jgi:hypothetical protein
MNIIYRIKTRNSKLSIGAEDAFINKGVMGLVLLDPYLGCNVIYKKISLHTFRIHGELHGEDEEDEEDGIINSI